MADILFTERERQRYARQLQLPEVGDRGQARLREARILVVGAGGLGCPAALYLAAAGVGTLTLVDGDRVELSNLQRQVLFGDDQVGRGKAGSAARRLRDTNGDISVTAVEEYLGADNAGRLIAESDLVLDCTDNFATRYLINDFCLHHRKPWLFAGVNRFEGSMALFTPDTACFRCLYPDAPEAGASCSEAGVMGMVPGLLGLHQAGEALKYLLGLTVAARETLVLFDTLTLCQRRLALRPDSGCICREPMEDPESTRQIPPGAQGRNPVSEPSLDWSTWEALAQQGDVLLVDVRTAAEHGEFNVGGLNVPATEAESRVPPLAAGRIVGLYCQTGRRSGGVARRLNDMGLEAYSLVGGIDGRAAGCRRNLAR
jgi:adenylyltransferase/sulfurtransferase